MVRNKLKPPKFKTWSSILVHVLIIFPQVQTTKVYGRSLNAYCVVQGLLLRKVRTILSPAFTLESPDHRPIAHRDLKHSMSFLLFNMHMLHVTWTSWLSFSWKTTSASSISPTKWRRCSLFALHSAHPEQDPSMASRGTHQKLEDEHLALRCPLQSTKAMYAAEIWT